MDLDTALVVAVVGALASSALGAWLSKAPAWKGAALTAAAAAVHSLFVLFVPIESIVVDTLVHLLFVGLIGGRWGLGLTARQMSIVVIGSILGPVVLLSLPFMLGMLRSDG